VINLRLSILALLAGLTLPLTGQAQDQGAQARLRLAQARQTIWQTVLELQLRYLERSVPADKRPTQVAYYLGRALLLRGNRAQALTVLRAASPAPGQLHGRLIALWLDAAAGRPLSQALPSQSDSPIDCLVAAERGFLLAWRDGAVAAGYKIARKSSQLASKLELNNTLLRRCLAYTALRAGKLAEAQSQLRRLSPGMPETRLALDAVKLDNGQALEIDVSLYAPEIFLCRALLAYLQAAELARKDPATPPQIRVRALIGAGLLDRAGAVIEATENPSEALALWRAGLAARDLRHLPLSQSFGRQLTTTSLPLLRVGAQVLDELLHRPALARSARQRVLVGLRTQPGLADLSLSRFLAAARGDIEGLGANLLDSGRSAEALQLLELLYDKGRRSNLWEFGLGYLARLGQAYLRTGDYANLIGYLYRRRTIPELAAAAPAVRTMARELQAFQAFDRQQHVGVRQSPQTSETLEALLFGTRQPGTSLAPRWTEAEPEQARTPTNLHPRPDDGNTAVGFALLSYLLGGLAVLSASVWSHRLYRIRKYRF